MGVNAATGDLVRAARDGGREAFGLLVERSWDRLVRLAPSVLGDLEAEDAAQEGLVVAVVMTVTISFLLDRSAHEKPMK